MSGRALVVAILVATVLPGACAAEKSPASFGDFPVTQITVGDRPMTVAVADTPHERERGLMGVTDLDGIDGMLFVFPADTDVGFWMKDTLIPLDIAFFDAEGGFVDRQTMDPCEADPCPTYVPAGSYRYALEAPVDALVFVDGATVLVSGR